MSMALRRAGAAVSVLDGWHHIERHLLPLLSTCDQSHGLAVDDLSEPLVVGDALTGSRSG